MTYKLLTFTSKGQARLKRHSSIRLYITTIIAKAKQSSILYLQVLQPSSF
jgi:hypothetical protein